MARASHAAGSGLTPAPLPYSTGAAGSQRRSSDADASSVAHAGTELRDAESRSPTPPQPDDVQEKIAERADHGIWFPEGGTKAWLTVAGSWACSFITFGLANSYGVMQAQYAQDLLRDKTTSQIAWIGAFQYFGIFSTGIITGRAFDVGLYLPLFTFGALLLVFCQMMLSISTQYWQIFLSQGLGLGMGMGIVFNLSVAVPSHHFQRRRASALGVTASGSSAGGICLPIMIRRLTPVLGFAWTQRVVGFLALGLLAFAWLTMSTRLEPVVSYKNGGWRKLRFIELEHFKVPAYSLFCIGATLILFGLYFPFAYMDVATETYGVPATGYWLSVLNGASVFGRILPGFAADRLGRMNTLVPHLVIASVLLFLFPVCIKSLGGLIPFAVMYGFTTGLYVSIIPSAVGQLGSTNSFGTRMGQLFFLASIGGLFGTPITGQILGTVAPLQWWHATAFAGTTVSVGTACIALSRSLALSQGRPGPRLRFRGKI